MKMKLKLKRVDVAAENDAICVEVGEEPVVLGRGTILFDDTSISRHHFELRLIVGSSLLLKKQTKRVQ